MSEFTNRGGVNLVERAALRLGWFFREQSISDQGIDAHVEKALGEVGTGRLIAIQIKAGRSYFSEPSEDGWVFRFDAKKANLWLNHALPVIVVLVDVDEDSGYWQVISNRTIRSTGKDFKVHVPRAQHLANADSEWTHLASGLESRAAVLHEFALTQVPPSVRQRLAKHAGPTDPDVAVLALHLAEGRNNPEGTVQSLLATSPGWIQRQASLAWQAVASYAAEHDLMALSADALERAAAADPERRGRLWAAAGVNVLDVDRGRARALLDKAEKRGDAPLTVLVGRALLNHPVGDASPCRVDPALTADTDEIRASQLVQTFLSQQNIRSGSLNIACQHARLALDAEPENSSVMLLYADALLRRGNSSERQLDDLSTAVRTLETALSQRRGWAGPTLPILSTLIRAYALNGQFSEMLHACTTPPEGSASHEESSNPNIRRHALYAAWAAGRRDMLDGISQMLGDTVEDRIARLRTGTLTATVEEQESLWLEELRRACSENDYEAVAKATVALASLGRDESQALRPFVEASIMPRTYVDLVAALVVATTDLDEALPQLRSLARRDAIAAEFLIAKLTAADRYLEAAENCLVLYEQNKDPYLLIARAQCLIEARHVDAEAAALAGARATTGFPAERADLFGFLGARALNRREWAEGEKHLAEALALTPKPSPTQVWRVVLAQLNQGKLRRAANTLGEYRPAVSTPDEAKLWLQANAAVQWDEAKASEALVIARRINDPQVSTALLGQIITRTHGIGDVAQVERLSEEELAREAALEERRRIAQAPVSADLHRQAFAALEDLVSKFGEATGVTVIHGDPQQLVDQMSMTLQGNAERAEQLRELLLAAQEARVPQGFVASIRGLSYAGLLIQRLLAPLASGAADDAEHSVDVEAAGVAIGKPVVVDAAALVVLTGLATRASLEGQFQALHIPAAALQDVHRAAYDVRGLAGSPGTVGWDASRRSIVFWELGEEEYVRQLRRAQAVEDLAETLSVRAVSGFNLFDDALADPRHAPWVEPIQLANELGIALWSDDLGLRRLARHLGVPCFGTPALIDQLRDRDLERATSDDDISAALERTSAANRAIAHDLVVDVALHREDLLWLAERDNWWPRTAGILLSRPSWWAWQPNAMQDLLALYQSVRQHNPESLPDWQHAAMLGAAKAYQPADAASKTLAYIALLGFGSEQALEATVKGVKRARQVAVELGLPDPLLQVPAALGSLARASGFRHPEEIIGAIMSQFEVGEGGGDL